MLQRDPRRYSLFRYVLASVLHHHELRKSGCIFCYIRLDDTVHITELLPVSAAVH